MKINGIDVKKLSNDDLQWHLDRASEQNDFKRIEKITKELEKRNIYKSV